MTATASFAVDQEQGDPLGRLSNNRYFGLLAATFLGATIGGVLYHAATCKTCKEAKGAEAIGPVARASAEMNGAKARPAPTAPEVVP